MTQNSPFVHPKSLPSGVVDILSYSTVPCVDSCCHFSSHDNNCFSHLITGIGRYKLCVGEAAVREGLSDGLKVTESQSHWPNLNQNTTLLGTVDETLGSKCGHKWNSEKARGQSEVYPFYNQENYPSPYSIPSLHVFPLKWQYNVLITKTGGVHSCHLGQYVGMTISMAIPILYIYIKFCMQLYLILHALLKGQSCVSRTYQKKLPHTLPCQIWLSSKTTLVIYLTLWLCFATVSPKLSKEVWGSILNLQLSRDGCRIGLPKEVHLSAGFHCIVPYL